MFSGQFYENWMSVRERNIKCHLHNYNRNNYVHNCIIVAETPICIITIKIVTHIFTAETFTCISAAETSNYIIGTEHSPA